MLGYRESCKCLNFGDVKTDGRELDIKKGNFFICQNKHYDEGFLGPGTSLK